MAYIEKKQATWSVGQQDEMKPDKVKSVNYLGQEKEHWANIADQYLLQPIFGGDGRVLIKQDPFKSRYECSKCNGKGHLGEICKYCLGTKFEKGKEENGYCRDCTIGDSSTSIGRTLGHVPCDLCHGTGGSIITPDESQTKTTMGNVLAVSKEGIKCVKVGDKVQYTNYTGIEYAFMGIILRVCCEKDLLCIAKKLKENIDGITEVGYADPENVGVAHE